MATQHTETVSVYDYVSGDYIGEAEINREDYERDAQQPEGIIEAEDILSPEKIAELAIVGETLIWCE